MFGLDGAFDDEYDVEGQSEATVTLRANLITLSEDTNNDKLVLRYFHGQRTRST
jgi:hypothetical protein